jgi:hypothetical protein
MVNYKSAEWLNRPNVELEQDYVVPRLRSLGRKYAAASKQASSDLRLVEGVFPLGPLAHQINLVVLLRRVGLRYEVVYSIPRRGCVPCVSVVRGAAQSLVLFFL